MRLPRAWNAVLLVAMVAAATVTYAMKHQAETAADDVARLRTAIAAEKDRIRTLNAEWSFLNQPARLQTVVAEHADYFRLAPFAPNQIAAVAEIPMRPLPGIAVTGVPASGGSGDAAVQATLARIAAGGALRARPGN